MRRLLISLIFSALIFSNISKAEMIAIDFGPSFGGPLTGSELLTTQLSSYGVIFSTTNSFGISWVGGDYVWPDGRYAITVGDVSDGTTGDGVDSIRVDFSSIVDFVSIRGFDGGGDTDTLLLSAYSNSDVLIDSASATDIFTSPGLSSQVSGAGIAYVTFEVAGSATGLFFDDLAFNTIASVPVPGTAWLFGSAVLGVVGFRLKRS